MIHNMDCIQGMDALRARSVDLVFADPPFNIGYEYDGYTDSVEHTKYLNWSKRWMLAAHRVLKDDGTFWLAIGDDYAAELKLIAKDVGFRPRSWVIWYYTFGVNCTAKFTRSHTHLLYFTKHEKNFTFRADAQECRVPSKRQLLYNDPRANPKGRLSDDVWLFPRVAGTFKERNGFHGCQMPQKLLGRIINLCSNPGDLVLDPFAGSGSTLIVAKKLDRKYVGFELSKSYAEKANAALDAAVPGGELLGSDELVTMSVATKRTTARNPKC